MVLPARTTVNCSLRFNGPGYGLKNCLKAIERENDVALARTWSVSSNFLRVAAGLGRACAGVSGAPGARSSCAWASGSWPARRLVRALASQAPMLTVSPSTRGMLEWQPKRPVGAPVRLPGAEWTKACAGNWPGVRRGARGRVPRPRRGGGARSAARHGPHRSRPRCRPLTVGPPHAHRRRAERAPGAVGPVVRGQGCVRRPGRC
jgi:hypothetical protein